MNIACWVPCPSSPCPGPGGWYCQLVVPQREAVRTQGVSGMLTESSVAPVMEFQSPHCCSSLWPGILPSQLQLSEGRGRFLFLSPRCVPSLCSFQYLLPYWKTLLGHCSKCHLEPAFLPPSCLRVLYFVWEARRERPFGMAQVLRELAASPCFPTFSSYLLSTNHMPRSGT